MTWKGTAKKLKEYEIYNFLVFISFCNSVTLNCSGNKIESLYHICFNWTTINTRIWWIMNAIIQILAQQSCIWWFERCCKSLLWDPVPILQSLDKWWIDTHLRETSEIYDGRIHSIWKCPCKRFRNIFSYWERKKRVKIIVLALSIKIIYWLGVYDR